MADDVSCAGMQSSSSL